MSDEKSNEEIFDLLSGTLPTLSAQLTIVTGIAKSNQRALRGSNGENGLVSKVKTLNKEQANLIENVQEHDDLLYKGKSDDEPGLVSQIRESRKFRKTMKRLYWLLIGAVVVGGVNVLFQMFPELSKLFGGG